MVKWYRKNEKGQWKAYGKDINEHIEAHFMRRENTVSFTQAKVKYYIDLNQMLQHVVQANDEGLDVKREIAPGEIDKSIVHFYWEVDRVWSKYDNSACIKLENAFHGYPNKVKLSDEIKADLSDHNNIARFQYSKADKTTHIKIMRGERAGEAKVKLVSGTYKTEYETTPSDKKTEDKQDIPKKSGGRKRKDETTDESSASEPKKSKIEKPKAKGSKKK